ncbi:MAG: FAD-binding oxidoreductase [Kiloniellales bacterium]|nr:FAD-binding oxidoreductase [Kiloniellales bacterium]
MSAYAAVRTPEDRETSGWYAILPAPGPVRRLEEDLEADWVVVGAGFAGLAAARRLTQLRGGDRIVLLDAQRIGWGAAGRNSGFMIDLPHELNSHSYAGGQHADRKQIRMNRAGIAFAREAAEEYGLQAHVNPCGKTHGATDGSGLKALRAFEGHLDRLGEPYRRLDAGDLKRLTGSDYYAGGTHTPGAVMIQPAGYVRGLAEGLRRKVAIFEESPVLRIESGRDKTLHTPKGSVRTRNLVLTVNGQIESFGLFERRLMHVFTYASMTRVLTAAEQKALGGESEWGLIPADPMGSTLRRIREGRIVVRNTFTYNPDMRTSKAQVERIGRAHDKSFRARFPRLGDVTTEYRWGGHLCLSLNSVPAFGEVEEGLYVACCQNGLGTVKGTLAGKLIADLACGANDPMVGEMLGYDAPRPLYPEPFMTFGVRGRLWWMHRRAGRDL